MREDVRKWIEYANLDLRMSEIAFENKIYIYSAYHAQQAAEKYLKAFLISRNEHYPRTHDIGELIRKCIKLESDFRLLLEMNVDKLTVFATETRYPEYEFEVTENMAREAIELAKKVRDFVLKKLTAKEN